MGKIDRIQVSYVYNHNYILGMEAVPIAVVNAVDRSPKPKMIYNISRYSNVEKIKKMLQNSRQTVCSCDCTGLYESR